MGSRAKHVSFKTGKPGEKPGPPLEAERGIELMILLLVIRLTMIGRITALIVWARKGQR